MTHTTPQQTDSTPDAQQPQETKQATAQIIPLRPPSRWHDPLKLIQDEAPSHIGRIVLWAVSILILILIVWAAFGQLDIIATAEGKLSNHAKNTVKCS